jgi:hypothetical protein
LPLPRFPPLVLYGCRCRRAKNYVDLFVCLFYLAISTAHPID